MYRIPKNSYWPARYVNKIIENDSLVALKKLPDECVALAVTSPPYWNIVDYGINGQVGQTDYDNYLSDLLLIKFRSILLKLSYNHQKSTSKGLYYNQPISSLHAL